MSKAVDNLDRRILRQLAANARASFAEIGNVVGLSGPAIGERIRRLQENGVIRGFTIAIDPAALGYGLEAIVRIKPRPGQLQLVERMIQDEPRFTRCDKVTGDDCFIARLALVGVHELDDVLSPMHARAETHTAIIKSSPVPNRLPDLAPK